MKLLSLFISLFLSLSFSAFSIADPQSKSFSSWKFDGNRADVRFTIATLEATRLPAYQFNPDFNTLISHHLTQTVHIANEGQVCTMAPPTSLPAKTGYVQMHLQFTCAGPIVTPDIEISTLLDNAPSHVHFAKFTPPNGLSFEFLFSNREPIQTINLAPDTDSEEQQQAIGDTLITYIVFGFEHILIGLDHIAFLLTLMLLARRLRDIVFIVTGFTIGHSITLSIATLGVATPNAMLVESMIGFTIALVAIENISSQTHSAKRSAWLAGAGLLALALISAITHWGPPAISLLGLAIFTLCYLQLGNDTHTARKLRPAITTAFGLIHGFGFSNVLMEVGLPEQRIIPALLGFNIGVELGQLAIVFSLAFIGFLIKRALNPSRTLLATDMLSASLCGLGIFWFIQRAYF